MPDDPLRILVVDDEKPLNQALGIKLTNQGYAVHSAFDGQTALTLLEKNHYDLVLLDLIMPKLDGFGVMKALQSKKDTPPIIVLSNLSQPEDQKRASALHAAGFFIKSDTSLDELVNLIKKTLADSK